MALLQFPRLLISAVRNATWKVTIIEMLLVTCCLVYVVHVASNMLLSVCCTCC